MVRGRVAERVAPALIVGEVRVAVQHAVAAVDAALGLRRGVRVRVRVAALGLPRVAAVVPVRALEDGGDAAHLRGVIFSGAWRGG
eukprot:scaffold40336_cov48-Phaeocystis_antarctica.AAC.1